MSHMTRRMLLGAGAAVLVGRPPFLSTQSRIQRVFVGTLTNASGEIIPATFGGKRAPGNVSRGLYTFTFDSTTGRASDISLAAEVSNPFNLTVHSNRRVLYACRWPTEIDGQNIITAFTVEGATLRELNTRRSGGGGPTVGVVDKAGQNLLTTNFVTSSIVCFRLNSDGSLGERSAMIGQEPAGATADALPTGQRRSAEVSGAPGGPHAVELSATERFAIVPEITADRCRVMRFDVSKGSIETHQLADDVPGAGPRHLVWHPSYRYLYTSGERNSSVSAWSWDESKGELRALQNLTTRPAGFRGDNRPADIAMHPSGKFVYVTNRSTGTLSGFRIDQSSGKLNAIAQADLGSPSSWSMLFDASGKWALAAAQIGDEVVVYSVDQDTGRLEPTGQRLKVVLPICLRWA